MKKGFTLIEILIASFIFSLTVLMVFSAFYSTTSYQAKTRVVQETTQAARTALETIAREIRAADYVNVYNNGGESECGRNSQCSGTNEAHPFIFIKMGNIGKKYYLNNDSNPRYIVLKTCDLDTDGRCKRSSEQISQLAPPQGYKVERFDIFHTADDGIKITLTIKELSSAKMPEKGTITLQTTVYKRRYVK